MLHKLAVDFILSQFTLSERLFGMRLFLASLFVFLASVLMGRRAQSNEVASHTLSFAQPFVDLLRTQDQGLETLRNTMEEVCKRFYD
ncbi:hypothetical protein EON65_28875 [archaeon]|nr:MAG: hypothetical protein EON65_28875 [archaeon]